MSVVLDASALLAVLLDEVGAEPVIARARRAAISTVNVAEVYQRSIDAGLGADIALRLIDRLELTAFPFSLAHAWAAADLRDPTRHLGLSLGDRACLALARERSVPVLTADRKWAKLDIGIEVLLIRGNPQ